MILATSPARGGCIGVGGICYQSDVGEVEADIHHIVPKRQDASEPSHFRSISLCTTLYKIYAKLLVCKLKPILSRLICMEQEAFVGGTVFLIMFLSPKSSCMIFGEPLSIVV